LALIGLSGGDQSSEEDNHSNNSDKSDIHIGHIIPFPILHEDRQRVQKKPERKKNCRLQKNISKQTQACLLVRDDDSREQRKEKKDTDGEHSEERAFAPAKRLREKRETEGDAGQDGQSGKDLIFSCCNIL
jgi:hypothetical protein